MPTALYVLEVRQCSAVVTRHGPVRGEQIVAGWMQDRIDAIAAGEMQQVQDVALLGPCGFPGWCEKGKQPFSLS